MADLYVEIQILSHGQGLPLPSYATPGSAGMDLCAALEEPLVLEPGQRCMVPTGFRIALPQGYEAQVRPRSGLAIRHGMTLLNTPGTVDADYRGEVQVILVNLGEEPVTVERGDRIAQLIVHRLPEVILEEVETLPESERGAGGFGHTGSR